MRSCIFFDKLIFCVFFVSCGADFDLQNGCYSAENMVYWQSRGGEKMSVKIPFDFDEYIRQSELDTQKKGYVWQTAIGLQDVDGLKPSEYLIETAKKNIDGDITLEEANDLIHSYYESKTARLDIEDRTEEADKVSARIAQILSEDAFVFSPNQLIAIHRRLFDGFQT